MSEGWHIKHNDLDHKIYVCDTCGWLASEEIDEDPLMTIKEHVERHKESENMK